MFHNSPFLRAKKSILAHSLQAPVQRSKFFYDNLGFAKVKLFMSNNGYLF